MKSNVVIKHKRVEDARQIQVGELYCLTDHTGVVGRPMYCISKYGSGSIYKCQAAFQDVSLTGPCTWYNFKNEWGKLARWKEGMEPDGAV